LDGVLLAAATLIALPAPAMAAGATHAEFSIAGEVAVCPDATYTVLSGTIKEVMQEVQSASGNQMFTVTDTPQHVVLVDQNGTGYTLLRRNLVRRRHQ